MALQCNHTVLNNCLGSDHLVTLTTIDDVVDFEENAGLHRWRLNKANWKEYKQRSKIIINQSIITESLNETFSNFMNALNDTAAATIAENKNRKNNKARKTKPLLFWNDECSNVIYERNRLRNKAYKSRNLDDWTAFKDQNAQVKRVIADTARESWESFCTTLTDQSKLGPVWNMARRMGGYSTQKTISTLDTGNRQASSNIEKASLLAETYAKTSSDENFSYDFTRYINKNNLNSMPITTPSAPTEAQD